MAQRATAVQVQPTGPVCSRALPLCQHRSLRYPLRLGTPTSRIDQPKQCQQAAFEVSYGLQDHDTYVYSANKKRTL